MNNPQCLQNEPKMSRGRDNRAINYAIMTRYQAQLSRSPLHFNPMINDWVKAQVHELVTALNLPKVHRHSASRCLIGMIRRPSRRSCGVSESAMCCHCRARCLTNRLKRSAHECMQLPWFHRLAPLRLCVSHLSSRRFVDLDLPSETPPEQQHRR